MQVQRTTILPIVLSALILVAVSATGPASTQAFAQARKQPAPPQRTAAAEENKGVPNALQGFSQNRDQPVQVESDSLEVRDKDKMATFIGNVHVVQGDTDMRAKRLVVFYDDDKAKPTAAKTTLPATGQQQQQQQIKRLEALGDVIVVQKEQTATGEKGIFDMKSNTITLSGNVLLTQADNTISGERLVVDMTTGVSRVEHGGGGGGRVKAILKRGTAPPAGAPATTPSTPARPAPNAGASANTPPSRVRGLY